jgi:hypothetical protein
LPCGTNRKGGGEKAGEKLWMGDWGNAGRVRMIREGLFSVAGVGRGGEKLWPVVAQARFHMFGNASVQASYSISMLSVQQYAFPHDGTDPFLFLRLSSFGSLNHFCGV